MTTESFATTNAVTAEAATQTVRAPLRPMTLIGVFQDPDNNHILLRDRSGAIVRLETDTLLGDLTLIGIGDGWAMVQEGATIHRLVIG
ncbi:hypothetical protein Q4555_11925 [Octadecabacter sp. 1_MG-2023]|uniref:hypothetical protein n=1 Tax=unclassified Octadecabacter TaxID=196158 RepID=UPI001C09981B|nr:MULTISPECIES: hypothetical protein [unclassified Octadecabacter]MBU2993777.1 hypothetical protein [Octadecabacter sp. B2R22]MDO6735378.1 hypothetical protein [Octadecabacter sp. 1_MG-2023]